MNPGVSSSHWSPQAALWLLLGQVAPSMVNEHFGMSGSSELYPLGPWKPLCPLRGSLGTTPPSASITKFHGHAYDLVLIMRHPSWPLAWRLCPWVGRFVSCWFQLGWWWRPSPGGCLGHRGDNRGTGAEPRSETHSHGQRRNGAWTWPNTEAEADGRGGRDAQALGYPAPTIATPLWFLCFCTLCVFF